MKVWAIEGGGDWADASVVLIVTRPEVDVKSLHKKYLEWYKTWDRKKEDYQNFAQWLIGNGYARIPRDDEAEEFGPDIY